MVVMVSGNVGLGKAMEFGVLTISSIATQATDILVVDLNGTPHNQTARRDEVALDDTRRMLLKSLNGVR